MKWAAAYWAANRWHFFTFILSPAFAGLKICCALDLGLAPPGFMLPPASQALSRLLVQSRMMSEFLEQRTEVEMRKPRLGINFTIFLLFFGVGTLEAVQTANWIRAGFWVAIGSAFLALPQE